ncbi:MAG: polysaccharide deacetylase family protein [Spirochaetaceae bacterium]|nr:polysaccharide deacetylase family protein [Spirochaetaceae bacterium]MCF7947423.1 polysaccharide deacetylase family protein [Spirochaetia bacterium]MCF7951506.1 polysaccharide deacetylase family protein [Spirochaetaceae bacterium]
MNRNSARGHVFLSTLSIGIFIVLLLSGCASTSSVDEDFDKEISEYSFEYRIAPWYGFRTSACSITFDDGTLDQYLLAFPELEKRNIKATFFLITDFRETGIWKDGSIERLLFSWEQARTMAAAGHEIASHSSTHADLSVKAHRELEKSRETIRMHIPALPRGMTFSWPYWRSSAANQEIAHTYFIGARSGGGRLSQYPHRFGGIPQKTPQNFYQINSMRVSEKFEVREMKRLGDRAFEEGNWLIGGFHGIDNGNIPKEALGWDPLSFHHFKAVLDYIENKNFWIAPFGNVLRYIRERNFVSVKLLNQTLTTITLAVEDNLEDEVYSQPLSIEFVVPEHWRSVEIYRNGVYDSRRNVDKGKVRCDIQPDGSEIVFVGQLYPVTQKQ